MEIGLRTVPQWNAGGPSRGERADHREQHPLLLHEVRFEVGAELAEASRHLSSSTMPRAVHGVDLLHELGQSREFVPQEAGGWPRGGRRARSAPGSPTPGRPRGAGRQRGNDVAGVEPTLGHATAMVRDLRSSSRARSLELPGQRRVAADDVAERGLSDVMVSMTKSFRGGRSGVHAEAR